MRKFLVVIFLVSASFLSCTARNTYVEFKNKAVNVSGWPDKLDFSCGFNTKSFSSESLVPTVSCELTDVTVGSYSCSLDVQPLATSSFICFGNAFWDVNEVHSLLRKDVDSWQLPHENFVFFTASKTIATFSTVPVIRFATDPKLQVLGLVLFLQF